MAKETNYSISTHPVNVDIFGVGAAVRSRGHPPFLYNAQVVATVRVVNTSEPYMYDFIIACLGSAQAADELLLRSMARTVRMGRGAASIVVLHGSGELAEDRVRSRQKVVDWHRGLLIVDDDMVPIVDLSAREMNKRIASVLTDEGVAAVPFHGADRGLLTLETGGAINVAWHRLDALLEQKVVPVLSCVAKQGDDRREVSIARVGEVLARRAQVAGGRRSGVVFVTSQLHGGVEQPDALPSGIAPDALSEAISWLPSGALDGVSLEDVSAYVRGPGSVFSVLRGAGTAL